jgi:sigma-B regulation protein RsbU (phosphoserine phosphatase)
MQSDAIRRDLAAIARISAVPTILRTICESTGLRFALVARVLPDQWVACAVHDEVGFGIEVGGELDVATTLCRQVRDTQQPIVIDRASTDPTYGTHPTPKIYGFESYIAVPIFRRSGEYFGNVCALDPLPKTLDDGKTLATLRLFAELISHQLEAEERHQHHRSQLADQREAAKLREQFIAVLGHDVRNPLASIASGTEVLLRRAAQEDRRVLERIRSSTRRIGALVDDLTDLARGRLGGGIVLDLCDVSDLGERLRHVVDEVQASHSSRKINAGISISSAVRCDAKRIEQLLSNLLANAIEHGRAGTPVDVSITGEGQQLSVRVANQGYTIAEDAKQRLFQPYFRGGQSRSQSGLGLGLFIVAEIAKSHGGSVDVTSAGGVTTFAFRMGKAATARESARTPLSLRRSTRNRRRIQRARDHFEK